MRRRVGDPTTPQELDEQAWLNLSVRALGAVAAFAGIRGIVRGSREVAGAHPVPAAVDSEYRFYAAWYAVAGLAVGLGRAPAAGREISFLSAGLWTAAAGRVLSLTQVGRPTRGQLALLAVEIVLPVGLRSWRDRVARSSP